MGCIVYLFYVLFAWFFFPYVQPGWTTMSLTFSAFAFVAFFSIFVHSCILLNKFGTKTRKRYIISSETSKNDYLKSLSEINVTNKL